MLDLPLRGRFRPLLALIDTEEVTGSNPVSPTSYTAVTGRIPHRGPASCVHDRSMTGASPSPPTVGCAASVPVEQGRHPTASLLLPESGSWRHGGGLDESLRPLPCSPSGARPSAGARTGAAAFSWRRRKRCRAMVPLQRSGRGDAGWGRALGDVDPGSWPVQGEPDFGRHREKGQVRWALPYLDVGTEPTSGPVGPTVPTRREHHVKPSRTIRTSLRSSSAASRRVLLRCPWATRRRHRPSAGSSSGAPNRHLRR